MKIIETMLNAGKTALATMTFVGIAGLIMLIYVHSTWGMTIELYNAVMQTLDASAWIIGLAGATMFFALAAKHDLENEEE